MPIKSIMCVFGGDANELNALETAFNLTRASTGNLRVLHIAAPPILYAATIGAGFACAQYPEGDVVDILEKDARELRATALAYVTNLSHANAVKLVDNGIPVMAGQPRSSFRTLIGTVSECLPKEGRSVDIIIAGCDNRPDSHFETILTVLFKTGSPVLTIPHFSDAALSANGFARTIVVAWDGSLTASKALRAALPHLTHAENVYLVSVEGMDDPEDIIGDADIRDYLSSHSISVEFIHCERIAHSIGHILLEKANDLQAGLIVMGAYGHNHIGEMILGGVSNHLLKHSRLPLFLAH